MEVSAGIFHELLVLGEAFLLGIAFMACYDIIRIFRRSVCHGIVWVSIEDACYWIAFGIAVFLLLYRENDGAIRAYVLGGTVLGILFYYLILGRWFVKKISPGIYRIKKSLKKRLEKVTIWIKKRFKN